MRQVNFVDDRDDVQTLLHGQMHIGHRLGLDALRGVEAQDLITKLMLFPDSDVMPLSAHGLKGSEIPEFARIIAVATPSTP